MIGLIKKALGNGKEYFLEDDDSQETEQETAAESESKKKEVKEEAKPAAKVSNDEAKEVKEEEAETSVKAEKGEKKKTAKKQQEKAAPEPSQPKAPDPLDLIVAAVNGTTSKVTTAEANEVEPFAPNHLLPTPTSRRRPGPSLNAFRDMARQVGRRS